MKTTIYYSPSGNPEVWEEGKQPAGYVTPEEWQAAHPAPEPEPLTEEELFAQLRFVRDGKLAASDWTVLPDAPLSAAKQAEWKTYRQLLRDLPAQAGAPWMVATIPWPVEPK